MAAKPIVDGIEDEFQGRLNVIRLNVQDTESKPFMALYNFQFTPTFILLDQEGRERWRSVGSINVEDLRDTLSGLR
ncbi:MAG: hypothetical protein GTO14_09435 [Anaerolineales bacterium]|nr:hypothetical protein [Anaerolineales bacterium]